FLKNKKIYTVVDVGTGSGCIIITLAALEKSGEAGPGSAGNHRYHAIDISTKALTVAKRNAQIHGVQNIHFHKGNLLAPLVSKKKLPPLLILANLPYGQPVDFKNHALRFEPQLAINGGKDGLNLYKKLFVQLQSLKTPWTLIAEIDPRQEKILHTILPRFFPARTVTITKDWNNRARVLTVEYLQLSN
ncbi:methyltransferase domain-containing protein, partial [Candidatus Uhrbacteria bacterium]|nr:methyltransferase domain-containing protein [Candidatus Uhrbacteria bacterium]